MKEIKDININDIYTNVFKVFDWEQVINSEIVTYKETDEEVTIDSIKDIFYIDNDWNIFIKLWIINDW